MILNQIWLNYISNLVLSPTEKEILKAHQGKVMQLRCEAITIALKISPDGSLQPVHQDITPNAKLEFSLQNINKDKKVAPHAEGDSELLAAFGEIRKNKDFSFVTGLNSSAGKNITSLITLIKSNYQDWNEDAKKRMHKVFVNWLVNEKQLLVAKEENKILTAQLHDLANRINIIHSNLVNGS